MAIQRTHRTTTRPPRLVVPLVLFIALPVGLAISAPAGTAVRLTDSDGAGAVYYLKGPEEVEGAVRAPLHREPLLFLLALPGVVIFAVLVLRSDRNAAALVLLALALFPRLTSDGRQLIDRGIAAFQEGDYQLALDQFRDAEAIEGENAALAYDQALCLYATGERGPSIATMVRCVRLAPGVAEYRDTLTEWEREYGLGSQVGVDRRFHPNIPLLAALVLFNITMAALGLVIATRRGIWVIVFAMAVAATLAAGGIFGTSLARSGLRISVVGAEGIVRRIPLPEAQTWMTLPEGTTVRVRDQVGPFLLIETALGFEGWMESRALLEGDR